MRFKKILRPVLFELFNFKVRNFFKKIISKIYISRMGGARRVGPLLKLIINQGLSYPNLKVIQCQKIHPDI